MKELTKLVAAEVYRNNEVLSINIDGISESLNNVMDYLTVNKEVLPTRSVIKVDELFLHMDGMIETMDTLKERTHLNEQWLDALSRA